MYNDLLTIGNITIHGYGLMIGIGIIAAYLMAEHLAKKKGLDPDPVFYLLIFGVLGGIAGAKIMYWITIWDKIVEDPSIMLNLSNGFVVYGGIILGILCGYLVCRVKKLDFWKYLDCCTPAIALAQGFGRIGCFLAGCCYGVETDSWFSITFTNSDFAPNNVALVPTQLISSAFNFLHFVVLYFVSTRTGVDGMASALYLIIYGIGRFIIEFYRGDLERGTVGELSTSQFISIFIVAFGVILLLWKLRAHQMKKDTELLNGEAAESAAEPDEGEAKAEEGEEETEADETEAEEIEADETEAEETEAGQDEGDGVIEEAAGAESAQDEADDEAAGAGEPEANEAEAEADETGENRIEAEADEPEESQMEAEAGEPEANEAEAEAGEPEEDETAAEAGEPEENEAETGAGEPDEDETERN